MFKQAWNTYWKAFNPRKLKIDNSKIQPVDFFWGFWFLVAMQNSESKFYLLVKLVPLFLMLWNNIVGKLYMPKAIYLTPMGEEGRKQYINALLPLKIGVPVVVNMVLHILYGVVYKFNWFSFIASAFAQLSVGIGMYVCCEMRSKYDRYIRYAIPDKNGAGTDAFLNYFCMILGMMASVFVGIQANRFGVLIFDITMLVILLIMDIVILNTRYQVTVDYICNYEESRNILGKVKK